MVPSTYLGSYELDLPIGGYIYGPVKGFYEKYFPDAPRPGSVTETHEKFVRDGRLSTLGSNTDILSFFKSDANSLHFPNKSKAWTTSSLGMLDHVFLSSSSSPLPPQRQADGNFDMIGVLYSGPSTHYLVGLTRLVEAAQRIFTIEPSRLFLHGFYIHNCFMEPWVFDRGGMYTGGGFHVPSAPERFLHIVKVYSEISGMQLGLSPNPANDNAAGDYKRLADSIASQCVNSNILKSPNPGVVVPKNVKDGCQLGFLVPELPPALGPWHIFNDGPVRYPVVWEETPRGKAPREKFAVKFRWRRPEGWNNEETLLKLAEERHAWGIVKIAAHGTFTSVRDLRAGLTFGPRLVLTEGMGTQTQPNAGNDQPGLNSNLGNIREALDLGVLGHSRPLTVGITDSENLGVLYVNPTLRWLALGPVGKPLVEYRDTTELLYAFRDAIVAHKSLYQQGRILHRDITHEHILITTPEKDGDPRGILIDLDNAIDLDNSPGSASDRVGTKLFMGIGRMMGGIHRYRHDLEGFFYVFLWMMVNGRLQVLPLSNNLASWVMGRLGDRVRNKTHDLRPENFEDIVDSFQPEFEGLKGLAEALRLALFPIVNGELGTSTDMTPIGVSSLYRDMIYAFDKAIATEQGVDIKTWLLKDG
ncbi:hypothetical protein F5B18DRAFT_596526 [Nemania serpens]|nr:hypothetical protein F5B18DRAFT_596526 [Nemania serpens]